MGESLGYFQECNVTSIIAEVISEIDNNKIKFSPIQILIHRSEMMIFWNFQDFAQNIQERSSSQLYGSSAWKTGWRFTERSTYRSALGTQWGVRASAYRYSRPSKIENWRVNSFNSARKFR